MPKIDLRQIEQPTWTPELVRDRMIEAVRWARYNAGPTGPAPLRSMMPKFEPTLADHLAEGLGALPGKKGRRGGRSQHGAAHPAFAKARRRDDLGP